MLHEFALQGDEHAAEQLVADVWMNDSAVRVVGICPANGDSWAKAEFAIKVAADMATASRLTIRRCVTRRLRFHIELTLP